MSALSPYPHRLEAEAGAIISVLRETASARISARHGRLIDSDRVGSMERKKQEGYF